MFTVKVDGSGFSTLHSFASLDTNWDNSEERTGTATTHFVDGHFVWDGDEGRPRGDSGAMFAINTDGTGFKTLYTFSAMSLSQENSDGAAPRGTLVLSGDTLYRRRVSGRFRWRRRDLRAYTNGTGFKVVHTFSPANNDGIAPRGDLILTSGTLYGSTEGAGPAGNGTASPSAPPALTSKHFTGSPEWT